MLSMVFLLPATFGGMVWFSYRRNRKLQEQGAGFEPSGAVRWVDKDA